MQGGSSSTNFMLFVRGHPEDYDNWSKIGCKGWSYKECLPYFKKLEDFEGPADEFRAKGNFQILKIVLVKFY